VRRVRHSISTVLLIAVTSFPGAAPAAGEECRTWSFAGWSGLSGRHVVIGDGGASIEKSRRIGDAWEEVSLPHPVNAAESEVSDIEQFSDGCIYATTIRPVSGPDHGMVCKSCDGGSAWSCADLDVPGVRRCMKVSRISEGSDGTLYAAGYDYSATADNSGVWRSTDYGATWTLMHALPGTGCTSVIGAADGSLVATTKGNGTVWRCADPAGSPSFWAAVFQTPSIPWGGAPATYPFYPPPVLPACQYLWSNYGEQCGGQPYASYPDPYRPDRTQSLFRTGDGTLFMSTNSGGGSIWSGGAAVRNFGHIYLSDDDGATWQDSGLWNPPPVSEIEYWGFLDGLAWLPHHHFTGPPCFGCPAADPVPTMRSFPTWVDRIWEDNAGAIYAVTSSGDPQRSWILDPRSDGIVFVYDRTAGVWNALGNLPGTGDPPGTDTYSEHNAQYCHDIDEDSTSGDLYVVSSIQALVNRSSDGGATWGWHMSPRTLFGREANGDFFSMELTCNSCLYVGYERYGEIYASRSDYYDDAFIQNSAGFGYSGALTAFSETTASGSLGTVTYWISDDGTTWYWWNGSGWASTTDPAMSTPAAVVCAHIGAFSRRGSFFFRAFLHPAVVNGCPKSPRLASITVCAGAVTPTRTPTPAPTATPAPTPTPCFCADATVAVSRETATPGTALVVSVCLPILTADPVDVYCVIIAPDGDIWSILDGGVVGRGIFPIAEEYTNPNCYCGPVLTHTVCRGAPPGEYRVCLALMPAGMRPEIRRATHVDWEYVRVYP
jgi:hypothetical protein